MRGSQKEAQHVAVQTGAEAGGSARPGQAHSGPGRSTAIAVSELTKRYGDIEAVRGINFEVATGETFGFLGPNGAGKSTTISILCTLVRPTSGRAAVAGHERRHRTGHGAPQHRPGIPGHDARHLPDR